MPLNIPVVNLIYLIDWKEYISKYFLAAELDQKSQMDEFKLLLTIEVSQLFWINIHGENNYKQNVICVIYLFSFILIIL